jgi:demethylmenaquinone methyltransferase/2-methoxy-6-polyprenyl-1,4-benzoquinol methylase
MDELPFPEDYFDAVVTSLALHATPPEVRRKTINEVSRVLKPGGIFGLVDWSRPRFGLWGLVWLPMLLPRMKGDNWQNTYPDLCRQDRMELLKDEYVNSLVRCQVFRREG